MKVCLSMYELSLWPGIKGLKGAPQIFRESYEIWSDPPAVFFGKAVLKSFGKFMTECILKSRTILNMNTVADVFLEISRKYPEHLKE